MRPAVVSCRPIVSSRTVFFAVSPIIIPCKSQQPSAKSLSPAASSLRNRSQQALDKQRQLKTQEQIGDLLVSMGLITERDRVRCLGEQWGVPYVDLADIRIDEDVVAAVTQELARRFKVVPIERERQAPDAGDEEPAGHLRH